MKKKYLFKYQLQFISILFISNIINAQVTTVIDNINAVYGPRLLLHNDIMFYSTDTEVFNFNINETRGK